MSPRLDVSEERKEQILDAASKVFTHKGFAASRMDDIAEQTGLSKGTLYLYFKSKDDVITGILDRIFLGTLKEMAQHDPEISAKEAIEHFTEVAIQDYKKMLHMMPIAYEFLALAFRNKTVQKALKQYLNRYMDALIPTIERGIASGEFRQVDAQEVAITAGAIFEGTVLLWVYDKNRVNVETSIRAGIKLLFEGILAPA